MTKMRIMWPLCYRQPAGGCVSQTKTKMASLTSSLERGWRVVIGGWTLQWGATRHHPTISPFPPLLKVFYFIFKVRALSDGSKFDGIATAGNSIFNVLTTTCCTFLVNFQKKVEKKTSRRVLLNLNKFLKNKNCRPLASISESTSRSREIRTQHSRPTHTKKKKRIKNKIENGRRAQIIIGPRMRIVIWKNPRRSRRPGLPHGECTMWYHVERLELADGWKRQWLHSGAPLREGLTGREQPRLRLADRPSRVGTPANQGPCYCFLRSTVKRWKAGRPQLGSVRQRSRLCWWNLRSSESSISTFVFCLLKVTSGYDLSSRNRHQFVLSSAKQKNSTFSWN